MVGEFANTGGRQQTLVIVVQCEIIEDQWLELSGEADMLAGDGEADRSGMIWR
jgi:hypothetical protein